MRKKLLKNRSVRVKMTLMLIIIMTSVILLSVLINLTMLKTYYTVKEKKTIKESYYQIQKVFQKDTVRKNDVDEIAKTYNYRVLISDGSGTIVYSSEGEKSLMYKSLWNILNENLDKISNQIKKQGYAVMTNTNKSMGTSINLMGYLDGDYTVIISTPMESIQTSARLSGQFTMYVGLILIICGAVAMYLYSRQFTRPIEDMAKAANQMSHLDFDVKVPTGSDDELGRLGASINELSSKLEFTISELKTANNELQKDIEQKVQIDEMRKEFLSHVSHELKTPLTSISGYSELIESGMAADEDIVRFAAEIHKNSNRLLTLINDIIRLSELDQVEEHNCFEELDIYDIAQNCVEMLRLSARKHDVTIELHGVHRIICANRQMMDELVYNLCDNAIRYNNPGGRVDITVDAAVAFDKTAETGATIIEVKDTGIGISKEHQERIFERFYRVDKSRSKSTGGTGLGLAIVKHIVAAHKNASLSLTSEPGKGTCIRVAFKMKTNLE